MAGQKFNSSSRFHKWPNGAVGYYPPGFFTNLGPYARVVDCPIDGVVGRRTVYATTYPKNGQLRARTKYQNKEVRGTLMLSDEGPVFYIDPEGFVPPED